MNKRPHNYQSLTGKRFGKWTVIEEKGRTADGVRKYYCVCDCGKHNIINTKTLRSGRSKKCRSCATKEMWEKRGVHVIINCATCGKDLIRTKSGRAYCCSRKCSSLRRRALNCRGANNPRWNGGAEQQKAKQAIAREVVSDNYVKKILLACYGLKAGDIGVTGPLIEIKRQQVIARRTLRQLKQWRKEYESNRDVISGKQYQDEAVDEITGGSEQAGHGCGCGLPAGM